MACVWIENVPTQVVVIGWQDTMDVNCAFLVVAITFSVIIIHSLYVFAFVPNQVNIFYDDCRSCTYNYQYIIRLLYDAKSESYSVEGTTVVIQISYSKDSMLIIPMTPSTMSNIFKYNGRRCAKIYLRTAEQLADLRHVSLYHNGVGSLMVHSVELQDVDQPSTVIARVKHPIYAKSSSKALVAHSFSVERPNMIEDDVKPTFNVSLYEAIFILYMACNILYITNMTLMIHYCETACSLEQALLYAFLSSLVALIAFVCILLPFRYVIKRYYHIRLSRGFSQFVLFLSLLLIVCVGAGFGLLTIYQSYDETFTNVNQESENGTLHGTNIWIFSSLSGVGILLAMICIGIPIAQQCDFFELFVQPGLMKDQQGPIKEYKSADDLEVSSRTYRTSITTTTTETSDTSERPKTKKDKRPIQFKPTLANVSSETNHNIGDFTNKRNNKSQLRIDSLKSFVKKKANKPK